MDRARRRMQLFTEDGIPIEPFHLKREREEGYFDAEVSRRKRGGGRFWAGTLLQAVDYCSQGSKADPSSISYQPHNRATTFSTEGLRSRTLGWRAWG
jgi:hypothetical protein